MKLVLDNLPPSLTTEKESLARCLEVMDRAQPFREVYLFGSHVRGEAEADSDVDLCIVAEGSERQSEAGKQYYSSLWEVWPRPALTLVPITPRRLQEKKAMGDHFFRTILEEGTLIATEDLKVDPNSA